MKRTDGSSIANVAIALAAALMAARCGDGTGGAPAPRTPPFVLDPPGSTSRSGSFRMGVTRESVAADDAARIEVFATVVDPRGAPVVEVPITFRASFGDVRFLGAAAIVGGAPAAEQPTDDAGTARVTLRAGSTPGRLAITATTPPNLDLGGLLFLEMTDVGFISGDLQVLPAEVDLTDPARGAAVELVVTGGTPFRAASAGSGPGDAPVADLPYRLENASTPIGEAELLFDGVFPALVRYTSNGDREGAHVFTVVDGAGAHASAAIVVDLTDVEILPSAAALVTGQSQVFAITGGVPPYTCSASGGTITPSLIAERAGTFTFTAAEAPLPTEFAIVCADRAGRVATASVTIAPLPTPSVGSTASVRSATR